MGDHSENWSQTMKTLFILLLALACALPLPTPEESNESSGEESEEINETGEDVQEVEVEEINEDFVIISSCVVEAMGEDGNLNEETLDKCGQCFNEAEKKAKRKARIATRARKATRRVRICRSWKPTRTLSSPPLVLLKLWTRTATWMRKLLKSVASALQTQTSQIWRRSMLLRLPRRALPSIFQTSTRIARI